MINTLILPACGQNITVLFGALKKLNEEKIWRHEDITEIYGTSGGSFIGLLVLLNIDLDLIKKYFVNKPWNMLMPSTNEAFQNLFNSGVLERTLYNNIYEPLFKSCDMELDITMKELYEKTNKTLYVYATNLNTFKIEIFSHKNHPNLPVLDAIWMSCTIPIIFKPMFYKNSYYLDGGIHMRNPIYDFPLENRDNVLAFNLIWQGYYEEETPDESENFLSLYTLVKKFITGIYKLLRTVPKTITLKHQVRIDLTNATSIYEYNTWKKFFYDKAHRLEQFNLGEKCGEIFVNKKILIDNFNIK